jgi:hypothetical protein
MHAVQAAVEIGTWGEDLAEVPGQRSTKQEGLARGAQAVLIEQVHTYSNRSAVQLQQNQDQARVSQLGS